MGASLTAEENQPEQGQRRFSPAERQLNQDLQRFTPVFTAEGRQHSQDLHRFSPVLTAEGINQDLPAETGELNRALQRFSTRSVKRDKNEVTRVREKVERYVKQILEKVKEIDGSFEFEDPIRMGSDFQRVAVNSNSDFDYLLLFKNVRVEAGRGGVPAGWSFVYSSTGGWLYSFTGKLSSREIRARFSCHVNDAIRRLGYSHIMTLSTHGPAVKIQSRPDSYQSDSWEVDLVPGFSGGEWPREAREDYRWPGRGVMDALIRGGTYYVAKLHPDNPDRDTLWSISFCAAENRIARLSDPGCKRESLRILKSLIGAEVGAPLNSYHLKNIWMYELEKYPSDDDWTLEMIGRRFMGLLESLKQCLQRRECKHFFIPEINLFKSPDQYQHLGGLANKVGKIQRDPMKYLQKTDNS